MKKREKLSQEQLRLLMLRSRPPELNPAHMRSQIDLLTAQALKTDFLDQPRFFEELLSVISYFTPWIWLLQAGFVALLFHYAYMGMLIYVTPCITALAPCLTLILLYELSKSFRSNMWEMEAACRYNLPRLFFLRLCVLSGTDVIVLGASAAAFCMAGGFLWQFALYTLLPFFLSSALCLWMLQHFGNRYGGSALLAACLSMGSAWSILLAALQSLILRLDRGPLIQVTLWGTLGALVLFLAGAFRLCTKKYYENTDSRKENNAWNFG